MVKNRGRSSGICQKRHLQANLIPRCPMCPALLHPSQVRIPAEPGKWRLLVNSGTENQIERYRDVPCAVCLSYVQFVLRCPWSALQLCKTISRFPWACRYGHNIFLWVVESCSGSMVKVASVALFGVFFGVLGGVVFSPPVKLIPMHVCGIFFQ